MRVLPVVACSLLVCCGLFAGGLAAPQAIAVAPAHCVEADLPITIPTPHQIMHGQFCTPAGRVPTTVQLLIPGGSYNRLYWDFPYQPERYSYQRDMASRGYATFAVDRLGTGQSTRPPSVELLDRVEAESIHQVVGHLRAGRVSGARFERVILVGHSLGSAIAIVEAATHHDVDGVILTGTTHLISAQAAVEAFTLYLHPVTLDPQLRHKGGDPGYITTRPGAREPLYYAASNADPRVIATDEATKDQVALVGVGTATVLGHLGPESRNITVPVLLAVGERDVGFCGFLGRNCSSAETLRKGEALYFAPAAHLSTYVLRGSGHVMALHKNTDEYREATRAWLRAKFGT